MEYAFAADRMAFPLSKPRTDWKKSGLPSRDTFNRLHALIALRGVTALMNFLRKEYMYRSKYLLRLVYFYHTCIK